MKKKILYPLIILCALIVATIVNIGMSIVESNDLRDRRVQGDMSHAVISNTTAQEMYEITQRVNALGYVRYSAFYFHTAYVVSDIEANISLAHIGFGWDWENVFAPALTRITGNFPRQANEIMASRRTLELLGIPNPAIGMEITLAYSPFNSIDINENVFILSGFYTDFAHSEEQNNPYIILTSFEFHHSAEQDADGIGNTPEKNRVYVVFTDTENINGNVERLRQAFSLTESQVSISPAFNENYDFGNGWSFVFSPFAEIYVMSAVLAVLFIVIYEIVSAKKRRRIANNEK